MTNMKVTALIPDKMVQDLVRVSGAKTITQSLLVALGEWLKLQNLKKLHRAVKKNPLKFKDDFSAQKVRELNRTR